MTHASFSSARHMQFIATLSHPLKLRVFCALGLFIAVVAFGSFANAQTITFENPPYSVGSINGQDGWSSTGPEFSDVRLSGPADFVYTGKIEV